MYGDFRQQHYDILLIINAQKRFLNALRNATYPEEKQKIGNLFIEIFEEEANKIKGLTYPLEVFVDPA